MSQATTNSDMVAQRVGVVGGKLLGVLDGQVVKGKMAGLLESTKATGATQGRASLGARVPHFKDVTLVNDNPALSSDDVH